MANYKTRYEYSILTTNKSKQSEDHWLNELEKQLTKEAVQPKRVDDSLYSQINNIINGNSKFKSVNDAVQDMQRRSGFLDYVNQKVAADGSSGSSEHRGSSSEKKPQLIVVHPHIEDTFKNYISSTFGEIPVPAVIDYVKKLHRDEVHQHSFWDEDPLVEYVHNLIESVLKHKNKEHNSNLGKIDLHTVDVEDGNFDAWKILQPAPNKL